MDIHVSLHIKRHMYKHKYLYLMNRFRVEKGCMAESYIGTRDKNAAIFEKHDYQGAK